MRRPTVLMIEDHAPARELVSHQLPDCELLTATGGEDGLERARRDSPDVLLLDLTLAGEMQGTDVLDAFREDPALANVPIIVLTGSDAPETLADCLARGAHDFLVKGYEPVELQARVAAAVRLRQLHDRLREVNHRLSREALEDPLTGLGNRRHGELELARMTAHAARHGEGFALIQADVDAFKATNDTHGHAVGDALLQGIARRLQLVLRREDVLVRWGGDEFVALLPGASADEALAVAERLRLAAHRGAGALEVDLRASVSIGWSCVENEEPANLIGAADAALYEAKRSGRDAVRPVMAQPG